jgi:hypothetical protein
MAAGKVIPQKLSREAYHALENVVGKEWVSEDRAVVEAYVISCIDTGASIRLLHKDRALRPAAIVLPVSTEEVQGIVKIANRYGFPIQPFANAQSQTSCQVPGTVVISMRRMNKIRVDEENMRMTIEPFVDYGMIHHEAAKRGLWLGGSGWHGAIARPCSQFTVAGLWQSDLKYCGLSRNTLGMKVVMPDGSLVRHGSSAMGGTGEIPFTERFPGPNLMGIIKLSLSSRGIITEMTIKLHPWPGGSVPEDIGRPSVEHYFEEAKEKKFDRAPVIDRFRIFWFDYPDLDSITDAVAKLASSGIGVALNIGGNYNAMMCSYTIDEAIKRAEENFFGFTGYMVIGGFASEKQLDYEEKVFRYIIEQTGGKLLSSEYKPELLDALSPWNIEFVLNTETGMRTVRSNYMALQLTPYAGFQMMQDSAKVWDGVMSDVGAVGEDRGEYFSRMGAWCPYGYIVDRGHQIVTEEDQFPERISEKDLVTTLESAFDGWYRFMAAGYPYSMMGDCGEPFATMTPEMGPDRYILHRKYRELVDPKGIMSPGRSVANIEEFKAKFTKVDRPLQKMILKLRDRHGLPELELEPEGDRWKPTK